MANELLETIVDEKPIPLYYGSMNTGAHSFDINKLPTDGYLVLPLSMSRLEKGHGQGPEECFEMVQYFENKVSEVGIDILCIYTNGLYFNNDEPALTVRKRTNAQMINHKNAFLKLLIKSKRYIPQAAHFIPWDYILLNAPQFQEFYSMLVALKETDETFRTYLDEGLKHREPTEANYHFLIEEIVVTHLIRQNLIEFPKTLVKHDTFRLVIYPGDYLKADLYQWKKSVLPHVQRAKEDYNPYDASHYNFEMKILCDFDKITI